MEYPDEYASYALALAAAFDAGAVEKK